MKIFLLIVLALALSTIVIAQNIGLGIANPTRAKLEVYGTAGTGATSGIFGSEGAGISLQRNWPTIGFNQYNDGSSRAMATGYSAIQYLDPGTGALAIDMKGYAGANSLTTATYRALSILNNGNTGIRAGAYSDMTLYVPRLSNGSGALVIGGTQWSSHFFYGTAEDTYIRPGKNNGNVIINDVPGGKIKMGNGATRVGINSGDPTYSLEIYQAPSGGGIILVSPDWYYTSWEMKNEVYSTTGHTSCLELIYGESSIKGWFRPDNGQYSANSDSRLKKEIAPMENIMEKIMKLKASRYQMKDNNPQNKSSVGFIAQEIEPLFPEVVDRLQSLPDTAHPTRLTDQYGINYGSLSVIALKGIQEQQNTIETLLQRVAALEEQNKKLEQMLNHLPGRNK